ncbi:MAG: glucose 1-dehydrogenase [Chloroflexi bacterium]|nr:glucose 1-dehydrogenase [Chloroflexota bacterium]
MGKLDGQVALITGGARGQGAAEAKLFASEGAAVVITDVLDADGAATARACGGIYLHHDVTSETRWDEVVQEVLGSHGRIDVLVNNAGIFKVGSFATTTLDDYMRVIQVNQVGVFLGVRAVARPMMERRSGAIVNISSIAGMENSAGAVAYGASKWAVRGMTKSAAKELGRYGIRVNSIHPGIIETPMLHEIPAFESGDSERFTRRIPLGRIARAEEVAKLALFLSCDDSSYCSGAEFIVDGAMTA